MDINGSFYNNKQVKIIGFKTSREEASGSIMSLLPQRVDSIFYKICNRCMWNYLRIYNLAFFSQILNFLCFSVLNYNTSYGISFIKLIEYFASVISFIHPTNVQSVPARLGAVHSGYVYNRTDVMLAVKMLINC